MHERDSTRRDRRHPVAPGCGWVTFKHPTLGTTLAAALTRLSVSGLAFAPAPSAAPLEPGMVLPETTILIGHCEIRGEVLVKSVAATGDERDVGGLFYPADESYEERMMTLIAGAAAVARG